MPWPQDFIVKTRYTQVWGIDDRDGKVLRTYNQTGGDNLAHYGYAFNADSDPMEDYLSGRHSLNHDGNVKWKVSGLTMHIDAASVGEVDGYASNGPCGLSSPSRQKSPSRNRRLYNWSIYSGWDATDVTFHVPGTVGSFRRRSACFRRPGPCDSPGSRRGDGCVSTAWRGT